MMAGYVLVYPLWEGEELRPSGGFVANGQKCSCGGYASIVRVRTGDVLGSEQAEVLVLAQLLALATHSVPDIDLLQPAGDKASVGPALIARVVGLAQEPAVLSPGIRSEAIAEGGDAVEGDLFQRLYVEVVELKAVGEA